ncbi:hypothetical protein [Nocardia sp. NPDC127526]|uniref:hypothetical protein n=1 Tax=Nocardia sp. NPDC127526 TaxID=3345393 RepID=UPI00362A0233
MTITETDTTTTADDPDGFDIHRAELEAAAGKAEQVRYACTQFAKPSAAGVREWLEAYGVEVGKSTIYDALREYRRERGLDDTGEQQKLTPEKLAELDAAHHAARADSETTPDAVPETPDHAPEASGTWPDTIGIPFPFAPESGFGQHLPTTTATEWPDTFQTSEQPIPKSEPAFRNFSGNIPDSFQPLPEPPRKQSGTVAGLVPEIAPEPRATTASDTGPQVSDRESGAAQDGPPRSNSGQRRERPLVVWPVLLMALSAFVAIWSGWVGLGEATGFGVVRPFPGISEFELNTAITLPIGVEAYASYALYVWLSGRARSEATHEFAKWSAFGSLALGAAGQIAYHLLVQSQADEIRDRQAVADATAKAAGHAAAKVHAIAPWWITTFVSCLPVIVVGMGAALAHMVRRERHHSPTT